MIHSVGDVASEYGTNCCTSMHLIRTRYGGYSYLQLRRRYDELENDFVLRTWCQEAMNNGSEGI